MLNCGCTAKFLFCESDIKWIWIYFIHENYMNVCSFTNIKCKIIRYLNVVYLLHYLPGKKIFVYQYPVFQLDFEIFRTIVLRPVPSWINGTCTVIFKYRLANESCPLFTRDHSFVWMLYHVTLLHYFLYKSTSFERSLFWKKQNLHTQQYGETRWVFQNRFHYSHLNWQKIFVYIHDYLP